MKLKKNNDMATVTLGGNPIHTSGELPQVGSKLVDFKLIKNDLSVATLADFAGKKLRPHCLKGKL